MLVAVKLKAEKQPKFVIFLSQRVLNAPALIMLLYSSFAFISFLYFSTRCSFHSGGRGIASARESAIKKT